MPTLDIEKTYAGIVAGVDEVGRGPWAGPVMAAAVVIPAGMVLPTVLNDSKKMTAKQREHIFPLLQCEVQWGIGSASVEEIDHHNILQATFLAMQRAVMALPVLPNVALIDGPHAPALACRAHPLVDGDSISASIAAASVLAKVTRDRIMQHLAQEYPMYGWEHNAGYGTAHHQAALTLYGITPHHRKSFAPIKKLCTAEEGAYA